MTITLNSFDIFHGNGLHSLQKKNSFFQYKLKNPIFERF
jgi:hypothetical protein